MAAPASLAPDLERPARFALAALAVAALGATIGVFGPVVTLVLAAACGVVVFAAVRHERGLILIPLAMYIPVRTELARAVNLTMSDVLLGAVTLGWLMGVWRKRSLALDRDAIWLLLALIVAAPALSIVNSPDKSLSVFGLVRVVQLWLVVFVLVLSSVRTKEALWWLLAGFVLAASAEALFGVYQYVSATGAYVSNTYTRAYGTGDLYNWLDFAISLGCAICLVVADLLVRRRGSLWRWAALAALIAGLLATYTRGIWIAVTAALTIMVLAKRPRLVLALVVVVTLILGGIAMNPDSDLAKRVVSMTDPQDPSVVQRLYLWETASAIYRDHPWIGAGPKSFPLLRDKHAVPGLQVYNYHTTPGESMKVELLSPHNFYLLTAAETGSIGLSGFILLFALLLVRGFRVGLHSCSPEVASAALGLSGALIVLVLHAVVGDLFSGPIAITSAFLIACLAATAQIAARETRKDEVCTSPT